MKYSNVDVFDIKTNITTLKSNLSSLIDKNTSLVSSFSDSSWKAETKNVLQGKVRLLNKRYVNVSDQLNKCMNALNLVEEYQKVSNELQRSQNEKTRLLNEKKKNGIVEDVYNSYQINSLNMKINACQNRINDIERELDYIEI